MAWMDHAHSTADQAILPNRVYDPIDILFNALAATMTVLASVILAWARRWDFKKKQT